MEWAAVSPRVTAAHSMINEDGASVSRVMAARGISA